MTRTRLPDGERRRTIAFTLQNKKVEEFDKIIKEMQEEIPFVVDISRASVLEQLALDFIEKYKKGRP